MGALKDITFWISRVSNKALEYHQRLYLCNAVYLVSSCLMARLIVNPANQISAARVDYVSDGL